MHQHQPSNLGFRRFKGHSDERMQCFAEEARRKVVQAMQTRTCIKDKGTANSGIR